MDVHERAALRNAPAWDRWQAVRMPETVDEADAAIALVTMKRAALERTAADEPGRADGLLFAADRWAERLTELSWAREVLRAGESPVAKQHRELRDRYDRLVALATHCPDTRKLIDTLQRRVQRAHEKIDEAHIERMADGAAAQSREAVIVGMRAVLATRDAEIAALRTESGVAEKDREIAALKADAHATLKAKNQEIQALQVRADDSAKAARAATDASADLARLRTVVANQREALTVLNAATAAKSKEIVDLKTAAAATAAARYAARTETERLLATVEAQREELAKFHATAGKLAGHLVADALAREKETTRKQRDVINELTARFGRLDPQSQAASGEPLSPERKAEYIRQIHYSDARAAFMARELVAHGGAHTPVTQRLVTAARGTLPDGFYEAWVASEIPKVAAALERKRAAQQVAA